MMLITKTSPYSGKTHTKQLDITSEQWEQWNLPRKDRPLIQDCFPQLDENDREFILTGITEEEWEEMYSDE